ncbi:MAG: 16S rRNA (uracil(1498)-N(3))-methyltransferase [Chloroflexi bacterium]|nr:16S rRNA (uracil(1498)-N(3))-methyltransferase [Chloroflexota bacterium]
MTLHRFFVPPDLMRGDRFPLPSPIERQVRSVLRLRDGDEIVLLPGDGSAARCALDGGECVVRERCAAAGEPSHRLAIVQALLKGDGLEQVIRRGTEVGVASFRLVVTERCVAREINPRRLERLRAVAREAAEQSERGIVPPVEGPATLAAVLSSSSVLLLERHDAARLGGLEAPSTLIVGPEGGWTPAEVEEAQGAGVQLAGLGPRILRSETVAPVAAAVVLSRTGDFA